MTTSGTSTVGSAPPSVGLVLGLAIGTVTLAMTMTTSTKSLGTRAWRSAGTAGTWATMNATMAITTMGMGALQNAKCNISFF